METVLHTLVTDAGTRDVDSVDQQLSSQLSVGAYWFN